MLQHSVFKAVILLCFTTFMQRTHSRQCATLPLSNHMPHGFLFCNFGVITTKGNKAGPPNCLAVLSLCFPSNSPQIPLKWDSCCRWLSVRLETLGALAAFSAAVLAIEARGAASQMGLTLSYALQITSLTSMTVRLASVAENAFNAVERMAEYSKLKEEAPAVIPNSAPSDWPSAGKVS